MEPRKGRGEREESLITHLEPDGQVQGPGHDAHARAPQSPDGRQDEREGPPEKVQRVGEGRGDDGAGAVEVSGHDGHDVEQDPRQGPEQVHGGGREQT